MHRSSRRGAEYRQAEGSRHELQLLSADLIPYAELTRSFHCRNFGCKLRKVGRRPRFALRSDVIDHRSGKVVAEEQRNSLREVKAHPIP
jgi:hypothetical protein